MSLPNKRINKVKLPGDVEGSLTYDIVPSMLGKNSHSAELPNLTADSTIALTSDLQDISVSAVNKQWTKSTSKTEVSLQTEWSSSTSTNNVRERAVAYGNGYWVVVGASGKAQYSTDKGKTFTEITSFASGTLIGLAYGNGYFLCACHDDKTIYKATNPSSTWSALITLPTSLESLQYVNGKFVATGENGLISFSTTGESWTNKNTGVSNSFYRVAYGNGKYVAVGSAGKIMYSYNGDNWFSADSSSGSTDIRTITYGKGYFVCGGKDIRYSTNGVTWSVATIPDSVSGWIREFAYAEGKFYCALYQSNGSGAIWSANASNLSTFTSAKTTAGRLWCLSYGDGAFVSAGESGSVINLDLNITWYDTFPSVASNEYVWERFVVLQSNGDYIYSDAKVDLFNIEIDDLTELEHAKYKLLLNTHPEFGNSIHIDFSQGYVLEYAQIQDNANNKMIYISAIYDGSEDFYDIDTEECINCENFTYTMINKTSEGLITHNYISADVTYSGTMSLDDLEIVDIEFIKVEGPFHYEV